MNVVSDRDEGARGICQKLLLAYSVEKIFAPVICYGLVDSRQWMDFSSHRFVEWLEIDTDTQFPILLRCHDHACTPGCRLRYFGYHSCLFHSVQLLLDLWS